MSSTINPNNIDTAYPIAGQDNDSQGFRDNFTNTKTNFQTAKDEIEELQNKSILKTAISGTTLNNDMAGAEIKDATVVRQRLKVIDYGTVESETVTLDASSGTYHKMTVNGDISIDFSNFAPAGTYTEFYLDITITNAPHTIAMLWPGTVVQQSRIRYYNTDTDAFTLNGNGTNYAYKITTTDAGSEMFVLDVSRDHNVEARNVYTTSYSDIGNVTLLPDPSLVGRQGDVRGMTQERDGMLFVCSDNWDGTTDIWHPFASFKLTPPASALGAAGDFKGMTAADGTYIYYCIEDYDAGATPIWVRTSAASW